MSYIVYKIDSKTLKRKAAIEKILSFNWQDDINNVFVYFDFETKEELMCGDWIELFNQDNNESVFVGRITKINQSNEESFKYFGYDLGFYSGKEEITIQFRNAKISTAMIDACKKAQLPYGSFPQIDFTVTKIYRKETLQKILKDLYRTAVDKGFEDEFYFDCKNGKINLLQYKENYDLRGYIANLYSIKSFEYIKAFAKTSSIEDMKNYNETINELKTTEENSFSLIGDNQLQTGTTTTIDNNKINIKDKYKIISSKHSIKGAIENVQVSIKKFIK